METLKYVQIQQTNNGGLRVEGEVTFESKRSQDRPAPSIEENRVRFGWPTDITGLRALDDLLNAEVGRDLRWFRVEGVIEGGGFIASFVAVRRRVFVDWSEGSPTPVLRLELVSGDPVDEEVLGGYATLTAVVNLATWRDLRTRVRDEIERLDG